MPLERLEDGDFLCFFGPKKEGAAVKEWGYNERAIYLGLVL